MSKRLKSLVIIALFGTSIRVFADAPCHTQFAVNMALVTQAYEIDKIDCVGTILAGPCKDEATAKYNHGVSVALNTWSVCCCTYGLACCG